MAFEQPLDRIAPSVSESVSLERERQESTLGMIASENHVSEAVLEAQGSVLTNKYAEGYPGSRYYGGCQHVDTVEELAIEHAEALFEMDYANVQPHSGTQANMGVYFAVLEPGDTILSLSLSQQYSAEAHPPFRGGRKRVNSPSQTTNTSRADSRDNRY